MASTFAFARLLKALVLETNLRTSFYLSLSLPFTFSKLDISLFALFIKCSWSSTTYPLNMFSYFILRTLLYWINWSISIIRLLMIVMSTLFSLIFEGPTLYISSLSIPWTILFVLMLDLSLIFMLPGFMNIRLVASCPCMSKLIQLLIFMHTLNSFWFILISCLKFISTSWAIFVSSSVVIGTFSPNLFYFISPPDFTDFIAFYIVAESAIED